MGRVRAVTYSRIPRLWLDDLSFRPQVQRLFLQHWSSVPHRKCFKFSRKHSIPSMIKVFQDNYGKVRICRKVE